MTHETIPIESEDASKVHILTGIVIDIGDGVADVNIDDHGVVEDIPVFYHCPESETADGNPFSTDDRVIIVNSGSAVDVANMKVIGYEDGLPRGCPFYIRPTFNGFTPTNGGEEIKLENDETGEIGNTEVSGGFSGLCGPFTDKVDTGDEIISLSHGGGLFAHFVEVEEEDAAYHYGYNFRTLTWYGAEKKEFEIYTGHPSPILHVNRVDWFRYNRILSECPKTVETIDGVKYDIYQVDFTGLYLLEMTRTEKLAILPLGECGGCGVSTAFYVNDPYYDANFVASISGAKNSEYDICDGFGQACSDETEECKTFRIDAISTHVPEFEMLKEQMCILSDEFGQSPSYSSITINTNLYIVEHVIHCPYGIGDVCRVENTDYPDSQEYKYEMVLTPEDKF